MGDVLIRDVPDDVLAAIDDRAARLGLSRTQYLRRRLAQDAASSAAPITADDLRSFSAAFAGLADDEAMSEAWSQVPASWLVDKSALVRLGSSSDVEEWASRIERGLVHIATVTGQPVERLVT